MQKKIVLDITEIFLIFKILLVLIKISFLHLLILNLHSGTKQRKTEQNISKIRKQNYGKSNLIGAVTKTRFSIKCDFDTKDAHP